VKYPEMKMDREKRSPEDLRRVLAKIYPEEMIDDLMRRLGFENDQYSSSIEEKHSWAGPKEG
jgi:hypothetical protein